MELHPNEVELINIIRHRTRYGTLEIVVKDGIPYRMSRQVNYFELTVDNGPFDEQEKDDMI